MSSLTEGKAVKTSRKTDTLASLIAERDSLRKRMHAALLRIYPLGSLLHWRHGQHWQTSRVLDHSDYSEGAVQAQNTNTGKTRWFRFSEIAWYETLGD